jgi:tripartite-type tricarboxylate transporter receptor subunit TctC
MYEWNAVFAPAGTPQPVIDRVHKALVDVLADPEIRSRLEGLGADVIGSTPAELETFRRAELAKWSALVKANNIKLD